MNCSAKLEQRAQISKILQIVSGNFLEMFDFFLFGFYIEQISAAFFPSENKLLSLLRVLMVFGAGFLMRPLGAIFLGAYIDRVGRRKGLIVTLLIMAVGTIMIAAIPDYSVIGPFASILIVFGRLLQGFSAGVELGGASVYLAEIAPPGRKGFYVSWQSASQQVAVFAAAGIGYLLNATLGKGVMAAWGWRIPFFIACSIIPLLFILRRHLQETREFLEQKSPSSSAEVYRSVGTQSGKILFGTMLVILTTVLFYFVTIYTPIFGRSVLGLDDRTTLFVTVCVAISNFFWLPIMGSLSDRVGRKPILFAFAGLAFLTAYPALAWLVAAPSFEKLLTVELWLSFLYASYNGAMVVTLVELFPASARTTSFSLAYSLATALFGGFTPFVSTQLVASTQSKAAPAFWLMLAAACSLLSLRIGFRNSSAWR